MASRPHLVALGSSFAAGPGITPVADETAMRSGRNYPHVLAGLLDAELTDLTVSGATTATILDEPQTTITGATLPPQMALFPGAADVVTVTAGGNDLGYAGSMLCTAWNRVAPGGPMATVLAAEFGGGIPEPAERDVERAAAGLAAIVGRVRERAPRARVLLVDYLTVIGDATVPGDGVPFEPAEIAAFGAIRAALEDAHVRAAQRSGAELVAASAASRAHGLGSAQPWVAPFVADMRATGGSFHPNAEGMARVADLIVRTIGTI